MLTCLRCGHESDDDDVVCSKCLRPFPNGTRNRPTAPTPNRPSHGLDREEPECPETDRP
jgi:hypothetical protein